jgi:menaquinone-dependent protoporphyrinogen oxidase
MPAKLTRRQFILRTAAGLGAVALACGGTTTLATLTPAFEYTEKLALTGADAMNKKILVAYATRCGSTAEVAAAVAEELSKGGLPVDLRPIKSVDSLEGYGAVVLGSAIRMGNWVPEALKFVQNHQSELQQMPAAVFSVHMNNLGEDETSRAARVGYHQGVRALITPAAEAWFAGVIDQKKMALIDRWITSAMKAVNEDKRDWSAIRGWTAGLELGLAV